MNKFTCDFCNKNFSSISSLNNHKNTAKYCLKIQNSDCKKQYSCEYCDKIFTRKHSLLIHLESCKKKDEIDTLKKEDEIDTLKKEKKDEIDTLKKEIDILKKQIDILKKENENEIYILKKEKEYFEYRFNNCLEQIEKKDIKITEFENRIEKLALKGIEKTTISNTSIVNNLNNFHSQEYINNKIEDKFDDRYLYNGMKSIAQFVYEHIITVDGNLIYICTDYSRKNFKYKDKDGNEITDPEAIKLISMIKDKLFDKTGFLHRWALNELDYLQIQENETEEKNSIILVKDMIDKAVDMKTKIITMDKNNKFTNELAKLTIPKK